MAKVTLDLAPLEPALALQQLVDALRPLFDAGLLGGTLLPAYRAARTALVPATAQAPATVLESLRQMTIYARALRAVVADEGHSAALGLARAQAAIGDPHTAIARATGRLAAHGINIDAHLRRGGIDGR